MKPRKIFIGLVQVAVTASGLLMACGGGSAASRSQKSWLLLALGEGDPFQSQRIEQKEIVSCMAEKGWTYTALNFPKTERRTDTLEARKRRGFGVTIHADDRPDLHKASGNDPNASYLKGLGDKERTAYLEALNNSKEGCSQTASSLNTNRFRSFINSLPSDLKSKISGYVSGAEPAFIEANRLWASCMNEQGFRWEHRKKMFDEFREIIQRTMPVNGSPSGSLPTQEEQERERIAGVADWDCSEKHIEPVKKELKKQIFIEAENIENPDWLNE
jgi:hypothetical protein